MKIVVINLYSIIDEYQKIEIELIEKNKNGYNLNLIYTEKISILEKNFKLVKEKIKDLLLKFNLANSKIVVKYFNRGISFFNLTLPKISNKNISHNIDLEMNKLVPNYSNFFENEVIKIKSKNNYTYRVILYSKNNLRKNFQKKDFNFIKMKKFKVLLAYELIELIARNFNLEKDINTGFVNMVNDNLIFYIVNNGYVVETFDLDIDTSTLKKYVDNYEYQKLLKHNDEYFRKISKFISDFMHDRNVFNVMFLFSDDYTDYLKKLVINNVTLKTHVIDYKYYYWKVLNKMVYEK